MSASETVLVVDPDSAVVRELSLMLEPHGYRVLTARNGMEAIRIFETSPCMVNLLLTAVMMPGLSGFEVAGNLTQWNRQLGVIFMSDHDRETLFSKTARNDRHFLRKPIAEPVLLQKVREALMEEPRPVIAASQSAACAP